MASTITQYSSLINVNFPVPGEDNDSQGFRSNFANIQSALSRADKEISDIQLNAVNLNETNDFGNNVIKRAALQNSSQVVANIGNVSSVITVDYALGSYQTFAVDPGAHSFNVINWPESGQCGSIRLEITPSSSQDVSISFGGNVTILSKTAVPIIYNQQTAIVWELWSPDNGGNVYAHELGLPNTTVTGTSIVAYDNVKIGDNKYTTRSDTSATVVATGNFMQEVGLVPHVTTATIVEYGCSNDISSSTTATGFVIDDVGDIKPGAIFWFNSLAQTFTVTGVEGNTITTQVFNRASLTSDPVGTSIRFVSTRYNQPTVIHTTTVNPGSAAGSKYDLKGQLFMNSDKLWLAHRDHLSGTNQWLKIPLLNPSTNGNVFESVNIFQQPIVLARYTTETLSSAPVYDGALIFNTSINRPMYCVESFGTYSWLELCCDSGGTGALSISPSAITITLDSGTSSGGTDGGTTGASPVWYFNGSACIYSETGTVPGPTTSYSTEAACLIANGL